MTLLLAVFAAVTGAAVGSFLNVVVHRVPAGISVVRPPSACPACGAGIRSRDNVPVLGWLVLRGRCRDCAAPISARYPLVEAATAVLFAAVTVATLVWASPWVLPANLYLTAIAVALTLIDLEHHRLPDAIVLPSYVVSAALLLLAAAGTGEWGALLRAGIAMAALYGLYFVLAVAKPGGMGFGDVKLAGVLGLHLGFAGWSAVAVGTFSAFLLGGLVGVALIALKRAGRRTAIPFGPFMLAGAGVGLAVGGPLVAAYLALTLG